jgi:cytochrome P450
MDDPLHALAAPSHPDPYPWYARLRATRPLFFDAGLGLWVASGAAAAAALRDPALRVRPPLEPVPRALAGTPTGEVFAQLVRMTDGDFHARHKPAVTAAARRFDMAQVRTAAAMATGDLAGRTARDALLTALPVQAMARLLGVPAQALDRTVDAVHDFTRGIAAGADADTLARAHGASVDLMAQGEAQGLTRVQAANRIAFMQQALDATAGLIGNALHAMRREGAEPSLELVEAVARRDPAVHNTRRFAATECTLAGERIAAGDCVLVVLVDPDARELPGFGAGAHACPGERIALQLAATALEVLRATTALSCIFGAVRGYQPLQNARIPLFAAAL